MSSVALSGNASGTGTLTIATPNTNTNYTFTLPAETGTALTSNSPGYNAFKNRIINGAMVIDQRNAGASVTPSSDTYTLDRWQYQASQASKFAIQQNRGNVTRPSGFPNYLGMAVASAVTIGVSDYFLLVQRIEGFNAADLNWGTANAQAVTLSFVVYSSLTGTFGGAIRNGATDRSYPFTYTINSANTWETKSITVAGDTTGTWTTDNTTWASVIFGLGVGSNFSATAGAWGAGNKLSATGATSVVGTNGATFYITGVQLEKGSTATSFDYRPYGTELALCQRYYYKLTSTNSQPFANGAAIVTTTSRNQGTFQVPMRIAPTALETTGTASNYQQVVGGTAVTATAVVFDDASQYAFSVGVNYSATGAAGNGGWLRSNSTTAYLAWSAEL